MGVVTYHWSSMMMDVDVVVGVIVGAIVIVVVCAVEGGQGQAQRVTHRLYRQPPYNLSSTFLRAH